jgi:hypothetical protein
MRACTLIVRGPGTEMRERAANDDAPATSCAASATATFADVVVALSAARKRAPIERRPLRPAHLRQGGGNGRDCERDNDYDDLLARVGAEMAQPSP